MSSCWTGPFLVAVLQNPANITNGRSCSSESNRLITTRNKPLPPPGRLPTHPYRKLTQFLIAIAANDDMRSPNEKNVLKETFAKVNLPAEIEVYTGAAHGWCPPDSKVYNEPQAEKAWSRLLALYEKALA